MRDSMMIRLTLAADARQALEQLSNALRALVDLAVSEARLSPVDTMRYHLFAADEPPLDALAHTLATRGFLRRLFRV